VYVVVFCVIFVFLFCLDLMEIEIFFKNLIFILLYAELLGFRGCYNNLYSISIDLSFHRTIIIFKF